MKEVTDSERIFNKVLYLNKQINNLNLLQESIIDEKEMLSIRINNLRDYYHEITKPGLRFRKKDLNPIRYKICKIFVSL